VFNVDSQSKGVSITYDDLSNVTSGLMRKIDTLQEQLKSSKGTSFGLRIEIRGDTESVAYWLESIKNDWLAFSRTVVENLITPLSTRDVCNYIIHELECIKHVAVIAKSQACERPALRLAFCESVNLLDKVLGSITMR
jgi:hypothetical protein